MSNEAEAHLQVAYDTADKMELFDKPGVQIVKLKSGKYVTGLDRWQTGELGKELRKKSGMAVGVLPTKRAYNETFSNAEYKALTTNYWVHNAEVIISAGFVIANPEVEIKDGKLAFTGEKITTKIKETAIDTLIGAGLFEKPKKKVWKGPIYFENDVASLWSYWAPGDASFRADADRPSGGYSRGLSAFVVGEKDEKKSAAQKSAETRQVDEAEYQELLSFKEDALKYREARKFFS